jgi:Ca2+-binding EF-hand superfamily protein
LFEEVDSDGSNNVSRSELEKIVKEIHFGKAVDSDEAVTKLLHDLDVNKDDEISENEFVDGFTKWLNSNSNQASSSKSSSHEPHQVLFISLIPLLEI